MGRIMDRVRVSRHRTDPCLHIQTITTFSRQPLQASFLAFFWFTFLSNWTTVTLFSSRNYRPWRAGTFDHLLRSLHYRAGHQRNLSPADVTTNKRTTKGRPLPSTTCWSCSCGRYSLVYKGLIPQCTSFVSLNKLTLISTGLSSKSIGLVTVQTDGRKLIDSKPDFGIYRGYILRLYLLLISKSRCRGASRMSFTITIAYLLCIVLNIITSSTAHPFSRFSHDTQPLQYRDLRAPYVESRTSRVLYHFRPRSTRLHRRGLPGAVYICTDQNFRGHCSWIAPNTDCHIPGTGEFGPESIGPDPDGYCILFEKATCTGKQIETLKYPGRASGMPTFMGLKCFADGPEAAGNTSSVVQSGAVVASGALAAADPRLPGGFGSMEAKQLKSVLEAMEKDGFKEGMIGLKKGHYY
jgi:hypothetical protein